MPFASYRSVVRAVVGAVALVVVGCQPGVREDRTITFSADGRASFQHGANGVFVTDPKTGAPKCIYEPAPGDVAFGPPAWDSSGKRMVFTVARALDGGRAKLAGDGPADGRSVAAVPVRYTCFLYDPATGAPEKLFEATASHAGYVAAGLAVAWHADGKSLDLVDRYGEKQHEVHSFDLTARQKLPVALPHAENVALGSAPGRPRYAVLGGAGTDSGLWIESAGAWWRVPESATDSPSLEALRRSAPRWARACTKLAFVAGESVRVCDTATRQTETWFRSELPTGDLSRLFHNPLTASALHWHPDGTRVGVIDGTRLVLVGPAGKVEAVPGVGHTPAVVPAAPAAANEAATIAQALTRPDDAVAFAGWDASGRRMAYVATEPLPYKTGARWATLFVPDPNARTAVRVADAGGADARVVVSGLRATFPHWSPTDSRLSVWLTVEPPYRLADGRVGMRPGDPAALIDPETGKLEWLPVNGTEHAQIGHVELRAGRLGAALKRFDDATAALPPDGKADWMLFRAVALQKAGRADDARAAWARFEPPSVAGEVTAVRPRHRFAAEAFVSLDMADEGIEFLRREAREAASDAERLSATVALCQMALLTDRKEEYATCVAEQLLPLAARVLASPPENAVRAASVAWTILPLAVGDFVAALPEERVRAVLAAASAWAKPAPDEDLARQLVLRTCARRLKDDVAVKRANERLMNHPSQAAWKPGAGKEVDVELLGRLRLTFLLQLRAFEKLMDQVGSHPAP